MRTWSDVGAFGACARVVQSEMPRQDYGWADALVFIVKLELQTVAGSFNLQSSRFDLAACGTFCLQSQSNKGVGGMRQSAIAERRSPVCAALFPGDSPSYKLSWNQKWPKIYDQGFVPTAAREGFVLEPWGLGHWSILQGSA